MQYDNPAFVFFKCYCRKKCDKGLMFDSICATLSTVSCCCNQWQIVFWGGHQTPLLQRGKHWCPGFRSWEWPTTAVDNQEHSCSAATALMGRKQINLIWHIWVISVHVSHYMSDTGSTIWGTSPPTLLNLSEMVGSNCLLQMSAMGSVAMRNRDGWYVEDQSLGKDAAKCGLACFRCL